MEALKRRENSEGETKQCLMKDDELAVMFRVKSPSREISRKFWRKRKTVIEYREKVQRSKEKEKKKPGSLKSKKESGGGERPM